MGIMYDCIMKMYKTEYPLACEVLGFCPFDNKKDGFPCSGCPYEKDGGYFEE